MPPKKPTPKRKKGNPPPQDPASQFNMTGRATRDVRLTIHPQIEALNRLRQQALNDYQHSLQRSNSIFGQEQQSLRGLPQQFGSGSKAILGNLSNALSAFGGSSGGGSAAENALASTAQGAAGTGFLGLLGSGQQQDLAGLQSARAAAGMQKQEMGSDILGQRRDALDQLMTQRQDVFAQMPALIRQREDELQQSAFERLLANRQFNLNRKSTLAGIQSNDALQKLLENNLQGLLGGTPNTNPNTGGGGGGGLGGGGVGGGGGGPQPGTGGGRGGPQGTGGPNPQLPAFQQFASGQEGWGKLNNPQQQTALGKINQYWIDNPDTPAFAPLRHWANTHPGKSLPASMHTPQSLIMLLRKFFYGPHHPGQPGGKQLP